jgi:hypothetical protein
MVIVFVKCAAVDRRDKMVNTKAARDAHRCTSLIGAKLASKFLRQGL